ncbi:hypothetical protein HU200_043773 [Digitaria exilis]|uniref:Uncharacterized protein n=1 Tax=Digitaria exilis TaxID=1010633 RepID=A0A835B3D4_9POAL|nr:hypothetical protein HU200_043773 [Digitaria exilis]
MPATSRMVIDGGDELKTSWPEVVGMQLSPAARKIRGDRADVVLEPRAALGWRGPGPRLRPKARPHLRRHLLHRRPDARRRLRCPIGQ